MNDSNLNIKKEKTIALTRITKNKFYEHRKRNHNEMNKNENRNENLDDERNKKLKINSKDGFSTVKRIISLTSLNNIHKIGNLTVPTSNSDFKIDNENYMSILKTKKKVIKSSEELILEEMQRYKFSAQPLKKNIFVKDNNFDKPKVNFIKENLKEKENRKNNFSKMLNNIKIGKSRSNTKEDNKTQDNNTTNKILFKNKSYQINSDKNIRLKENKITTKLFQIDNRIKEISSMKSKSVFKANPTPNFTAYEVKKSTKILTTPISPNLKTKSRSTKKLEKIN